MQSDAPGIEGGGAPGGAACLEPDEAAGFVQGWLTGAELARAEAHIDGCGDCRRYVSDLARTSVAYEPPSGRGGAAEAATVPAEGPPSVAGPGRLLPRGSSLGRYVVDGLLGAGGMGVVYAAYDPKLDRKVALKMVHTEAAERREARERLLREARAMARLTHPNVVAVYDVDVHAGQLFLAMEYVDGITLRSWLRRASRPAREVLAAFVQAGRGLSAAHAVGVVHRDFKPDNVLVDRGGRVCVTDFGLARSALGPHAPGLLTADDAAPSVRGVMPPAAPSPGVTRTGALMGTPAYMAPEQWRGEATDARSDQFSFCVALYEALYGQHPFEGATAAALLDAIQQGRLREAPAGGAVPLKAQRALQRGLSAEPGGRFGSMDDLLAALAEERAGRRLRAAAALAALLAAGGLALGYRSARRAAQPTCAGAEQRLEGVWDDARKGAARAAFLGTSKPFAPDAWRGVERALDLYTSDWAAARHDACEATHVRGEQSAELLDLRMACLDERLKEAGALAEVFAHADADVVAKSVGATQSLTPLAACADRKALLARSKPAADAATAAKAAALRGELGRAKALADAGKYRDAFAAASEAAGAAEALGDRGLWAEALLRRGQVQGTLGGMKEGEATLRRAVSLADAAGDDRTRAAACTSLLFSLGSIQASYDVVPLLDEQARSAIARLGGDPGLEGSRARHFATALLRQGKLDAALREFEIALPLLERAYGPESREVQKCLNNIGQTHANRGDYDAAWAVLRRAADLAEATLGPHHPEVWSLLNNLGVLLEQQARYAEAEPYFVRTLAVQEESLGPQSPRLWVYLNNVGQVLSRQGHHRRALPYLERALALCETYGPDFADLLYPLSGLGQAYLELGDRRQAIAYLERAIKARSYPEGAADHAYARFSLARALTEAGRDRRRARVLAIEAREALRASAKSPLDKQRLALVEQWFGRRPKG